MEAGKVLAVPSEVAFHSCDKLWINITGYRKRAEAVVPSMEILKGKFTSSG